MTAASVLAIAASLLATPGLASATSYATDGFYAAAGLPDGGGFCITPGGTAPAGTYGLSGQTNNGAEATVMYIATQYGVVGAYDPTGTQVVYGGVPGATGGTGYGGIALSPQEDTITAEQIANDMTLGINDTDHTDSDTNLVNGIYNFAKANPGPWYLKAGGSPGPYVEGSTYTASVTVTNANGGTVPISNLPLAVTGVTGVTITPTGPMVNGVASFTVTMTATSWSFSIGSTGLAAGTAGEYQNTSDPGGYQTLTTPTAAPYATTFSGTAPPPTPPTSQPVLGSLTIVKTDAATGAGLAGAVFSVTGPNGFNTSVTTGASGSASLSNLVLGTYTITETTPPPGFQLANPDTQTVDLTTSAATATVSFADAPVTGGLTITKTDSTGGAGLAGAVFSVTGPGGYSTSVTTGSGGSASLSGLALGTYTVTETGAPTGFEMANPPSQTVDVASSATVDVTFSDAPQPATLSTAVSSATLTVGQTLSDTLMVGGITANGGIADTSASWSLLGPVPMTDGSCAGTSWWDAQTVISGTVSIPGNGTYSTGASPVLQVAGCYGYAVTVEPNAWTAGAWSWPGASNEQSAVAPTISTAAQSSGPTVGSTISDEVTIAGLSPTTTSSTPSAFARVLGPPPAAAVTGDLTWTILGPVAAPNGSCAGLNWTGAPVFDTGSYVPVNGTTSTGVATAPVVTVAGCYGYKDVLSSPGGYFLPITAGPSAVEARYFAPTISTQASASGGTVGSTMSDAITVTGLPASGGSVAWDVLGPVAAPNGSCADVSWTGAPLFTRGITSAKNGTSITLPTPKIQVAGCYAYSGGLSSETGAFAPVSAPPGPTEAEYFAPTISTTAQSSGPAVGSTMSDAITVTGLPASGGSVAWDVLGPVAAPKGSCADVSWTGAPLFTHGVTSVKDGTAVTLPTPKIQVAGCYAYAEVLSSPAGAFAPVSAPPGPTEAEYLAPTISTTAQSSGPAVGSTMSDAITVTGLPASGGSVAWDVLGPVAAPKGSCADVSWTGAPLFTHGVTSAKDGTAVTLPTPKIQVAGCYAYAEVLSSPAGAFAPVSAPPGPTEAEYLAPTISTQASQSGTAAGSTLDDTASIGGLGPAQPATLKWVIYGPIAPNKSGTCSGLSWAKAPRFDAGQVPAKDGLVKTGNSIPVATAGCYGYSEVLSSPTGQFAPVVAGITASETAYLTPSLVTKAASTPVNGSGPSAPGTAVLADHATLTGVNPAAARVTWQVYGPVTGQACSAVNWAKAPVFASGSEPVPGETFTVTAPKSVVENGCYAFADTVTSTNGAFTPLVVRPGVAPETLAASVGSAGAAPPPPGLINSGHPGAPIRGNPWLVGTGAGVIALGLGLAVYAVAYLRRDAVLPES
jgi:hypothetical protein